ncbi:MAG: DUF4384 domain-containing protein [Pyrinomonadaceae bacterium]
MLKYFLIIAVFAFFPVITQGQDTEDQTRDLWDTGFLQKRPAGKKQVKRTQPIRYKVVGRKALSPSPTLTTQAAVVGVTIWRMRPSKTTDDEEVRQLIHEQGEWTPERVSAGTPLSEGSRVQLTIESPRSGYLYVFDREIYADKTFGEPYLIFPTLSLNSGDNKVSAGRVIEIPSTLDKPSYYTLKRSRADHEGEALTVIVTDKPLTELTIERSALKLSAEQFNSYEKQWGALTQQLELDGGEGTAMSKTEKAAGAGKKVLTQDDLPPQTIYQIMTKPNQPLLLTIPLSISAQADKANEKLQP